MKCNFFRFGLLCSMAFLLGSCVSDNEVAVSVKPYFSSLTFGKNDSIPNLSKAVFTLVEIDPVFKDSMIVNVDSLPYKTRIDSVFPTFTFQSSLAQFIIDGNDTTKLTGKDTIDFSRVLKVRNIAADGKSEKTYLVKVNVHQVEPEQYVWKQLSPGIEDYNALSQKAIVVGDTICYFMNNGSDATLFKSVDGQLWKESALSGFPVNTQLNDMQLFNGKLFVTKDGDRIYSAAGNYQSWTEKKLDGYNIMSLLYVFDNKLWAVVQSQTDKSYRFATSVDGDAWIVRGEIPNGFPVRDFSAISFASRINKPKVLVVGGYLSDNTLSKHRWSSEDGAYWSDFRPDVPYNRTLDTLAAGASIISYDNKLLLMGMRSDSLKLQFKVSKDEGLSWQTPDTLATKLLSDYSPRSYQSMVVLHPRKYNKSDAASVIKSSNRIFIIGGKNPNKTYLDVWTGKLNRLNFLIQ